MAVTSNILNDEIKALTPGASEWDISNLIAARQERGAKFDPESVYPMETICRELATRYAQAYSGTFAFMLDMKKEVFRGRLSIGKVTAIINAWYNDVRSLQIQAERDAKQARYLANTKADVPDGTVASDAVVPDGIYGFGFTDGTVLAVRVRVKAGDPGTQKIAALVYQGLNERFQDFGFLKGARYVPFSAYKKGYDRWHFIARKLAGEMTEEDRTAAARFYLHMMQGGI